MPDASIGAIYPPKEILLLNLGDNMKIFLGILLSLSYSFAFANPLTVVCNRPGITTENQFDLIGVVDIAEDGISLTASFEYTIRERGRDVEEESGLIDGHGTLKVIPAGSMMANDDVTQIQLVDKDAHVQYVSIVGGHNGALISQIRFSNGKLFRSKCSVK